jgi:hypothetical protein
MFPLDSGKKQSRNYFRRNNLSHLRVIFTGSDEKHVINVNEPVFSLSPRIRQKKALIDYYAKTNESGPRHSLSLYHPTVREP